MGRRRSRSRSSTLLSASSSTSASLSARTMFTEVSTRSRIMDSTSRPTYPTSVNLEASTFTKGAPARRARRREISVFPTPVGPMRMRLLGRISSLSSPSTLCRRHRFLREMATAFFASSWPTMYLSNSRDDLPGGQSPSCPSPGSYHLPAGLSCSVILLVLLQLQHADLLVGVNADLPGDLQGPLDDLRGRKIRVGSSGPGPPPGHRSLPTRWPRSRHPVR